MLLNSFNDPVNSYPAHQKYRRLIEAIVSN